MKLLNLNFNTFSPYGVLLKNLAEDENLIEEKLSLISTDEIKIYKCNHTVTIDYKEGMTVLTIFEGNEQLYFYLDRIVQINAGVSFALFPLEQSSSVIMIHPFGSTLEIIKTKKPNTNAETFPFSLERIFTVFYQETSGNFYFRGESHSPFELVYVDQGSLHNIINGHDYVVSQQECIIIDRNQWHIQYSDLPVKFLTVSFCHTGNLSQLITDKVIKISTAIKPILTKILEEQNEYQFSDEYLKALMQIFLIALIRTPDINTHTEKAPSTLFSENLLVDKALKIISENISKKIVLNNLANELHISVPYLYKLFSEHLKMPPGQYIMKIKLEESKILLREGKKNIGIIANECGFTSIQHYSRQFRQHFNMSPSEYIKSLR